MIKPYVHQVQYYETDKMKITNNTNYIRFMEEARNDYLSQIHFPYSQIEAHSIISPVVSVNCKYRRTTTYPDRIAITVQLVKVNHFKLDLRYIMRVRGHIVCTASSQHCFIKSGKIVNIAEQMPRLYRSLKAREVK